MICLASQKTNFYWKCSQNGPLLSEMPRKISVNWVPLKKKYLGTVNATEALSKCQLSGRKIHIAIFTRLVLAKFEKFCLAPCSFFSIVNFPITLHAVPHQCHLTSYWFHPVFINSEYFKTFILGLYSDPDLVNRLQACAASSTWVDPVTGLQTILD